MFIFITVIWKSSTSERFKAKTIWHNPESQYWELDCRIESECIVIDESDAEWGEVRPGEASRGQARLGSDQLVTSLTLAAPPRRGCCWWWCDVWCGGGHQGENVTVINNFPHWGVDSSAQWEISLVRVVYVFLPQRQMSKIWWLT